MTTIHVLYYVSVSCVPSLRAPSWGVLVQLYVFWSPMKSSAFFLEIIRHLSRSTTTSATTRRGARGHNLLRRPVTVGRQPSLPDCWPQPSAWLSSLATTVGSGRMSRRGSAAALPLWLATLLLVSMAVDPARSMLMQPADPRTSNWDTWLLLNDSHVNYFYLKGTNCTPHCLNYLHGWDGIGLATAPLGTVQFTDRGEVLHMDPPAPDLHWLGSGSVYLAPNRAAVGGARYIMTYSQGPGAGTRPTTAAASQKIYFATVPATTSPPVSSCTNCTSTAASASSHQPLQSAANGGCPIERLGNCRDKVQRVLRD